jgi:iron(III) transport system ATP-binding protein
MSRAEVRNVTKAFGKVIALDDVSLAVEPGEFLAIVGSSGCGKTTLLRLIAGFELPTAGTVHVSHREVSSPTHSLPPERRDIGMVFQTFALWPHMKVADQIRFPLEHRKGLDPGLARRKEERIDEVLELTGLSDYRDRYPNELSGGQQQRVGLARAIAPNPSLLLMDEPLSALDAELREELRREIQTLHRVTGVSILYVTHDQTEALSMSDRVVVMRHGRLEQVGTPDEIYHRPNSEFVARFVGRSNLVPGTWDGEVFRPSGAEVSWAAPEVAESFRERGVLPLRPEELAIVDGDQGIPGTVVNALFSGREMHYTVELPSGPVQIYTSANVQRDVGATVRVVRVGADAADHEGRHSVAERAQT